MKKKKNLLSEITLDELDPIEHSKFLVNIYYWVGKYIVHFNYLEDTITDLAAEHIDGHLEKNDYAFIFLSDRQYNSKVDLLERYYRFIISIMNKKHGQQEILNRIELMFLELKRIGKERNSIVHANYFDCDKDGYLHEKVKYQKGIIEENRVEINKEFLSTSIKNIIEVNDKLWTLDEDINNYAFCDSN